ncbi:Hypothetical protein A7982_05973 [Minicystis rosea]|nr:Hypothetical protein A7982_05973 [Minicystis rosea]
MLDREPAHLLARACSHLRRRLLGERRASARRRSTPHPAAAHHEGGESEECGAGSSSEHGPATVARAPASSKAPGGKPQGAGRKRSRGDEARRVGADLVTARSNAGRAIHAAFIDLAGACASPEHEGSEPNALSRAQTLLRLYEQRFGSSAA